MLSETNSSDYKYQITGDKIDVPSQLYPRKTEFYWPSLSLPKVCFKLLFLKVRVRKWGRNSGKATVPKFRLHFLASPSAAPYLYGAILRGPRHITPEKNTVSFLDDKAVYFKIGLFFFVILPFREIPKRLNLFVSAGDASPT